MATEQALDAAELLCLSLLACIDGDLPEHYIRTDLLNCLCDLAYAGLAQEHSQETPAGYRKSSWSITPEGLRVYLAATGRRDQ